MDVSEPMIETGVSFAVTERWWARHRVGLSFSQVKAALGEAALKRFEELPLIKQVFAIRAIEEVALCKFRETRRDPDYRAEELLTWRQIVVALVGDEGLEGLGL